MKNQTAYILVALFISVFFSCKEDKWAANRDWYEETKMEILKQSDLEADSVVANYFEDSTIVKKQSFANGKIFLWTSRNKNGLGGADIYFSKNGEFELRREICHNGAILFEGIAFKDQLYGLSTYWKRGDCDKIEIEKQGVWFRDKAIGIWQTNREGGIIEEIDHGNLDKLDSMPVLSGQ